MGIEHALFVKGDSISDSFVCKICLLVLEDPIKMECGHYFCQTCIQHWVQSQQTCPTCRTHQNNTDLLNWATQARVLSNLLGEEERYCENRPQGCHWVGPGIRLAAHLADDCLAVRVQVLQRVNERLTGQLEQRLHQSCYSARDSVLVQGAGHPAVNGWYHRIRDNNGTCAFQSSRSAGNPDESFTLFRCKMTDGTHLWYISIVPPNRQPGTQSDIDFYFSISSEARNGDSDVRFVDELPPKASWAQCRGNPNAVPPTPTITCVFIRSVIIQGACPAANGHYHRIQDNDGTCAFQMNPPNAIANWTLFRCKMDDGTHHWCISIVQVNPRPGTHSAIDFYHAKSDSSSWETPPMVTWQEYKVGLNKTPSVSLVWTPVV